MSEGTVYTNTTGKAIYVNADKSKVVEEGSAEAAFLLVGPDGQLPQEEADKYGLKAEPKKADKANDSETAAGASPRSAAPAASAGAGAEGGRTVPRQAKGE